MLMLTSGLPSLQKHISLSLLSYFFFTPFFAFFFFFAALVGHHNLTSFGFLGFFCRADFSPWTILITFIVIDTPPHPSHPTSIFISTGLLSSCILNIVNVSARSSRIGQGLWRCYLASAKARSGRPMAGVDGLYSHIAFYGRSFT
jgi:hypothetical protein